MESIHLCWGCISGVRVSTVHRELVLQVGTVGEVLTHHGHTGTHLLHYSERD